MPPCPGLPSSLGGRDGEWGVRVLGGSPSSLKVFVWPLVREASLENPERQVMKLAGVFMSLGRMGGSNGEPLNVLSEEEIIQVLGILEQRAAGTGGPDMC